MVGGCDGWCCGGVQYLNEIKDSVVAGFQWASKEVCVCVGGCDGWSGVQYLNEIKDSVVAGFQWASKEVCVCGGGV